jgi:alanine racemase
MLEYTQLYRPIDVHLKMNTGMNRLGFNPDEYAPPTRLRAIPGVRNITLMTHFRQRRRTRTSAPVDRRAGAPFPPRREWPDG